MSSILLIGGAFEHTVHNSMHIVRYGGVSRIEQEGKDHFFLRIYIEPSISPYPVAYMPVIGTPLPVGGCLSANAIARIFSGIELLGGEHLLLVFWF